MTIQFKSDPNPLPDDHIMARWSKVFLEAGDRMGKTFRIANMAKDLITDAGFVDVVEKKYMLPVGDWMADPKMKEVGRWNLLYTVQGLEGWALFLLAKIMKVREYKNRRLKHTMLKRASCSGSIPISRPL